MFPQAPVELVVDLANYWNSLETGSPLSSEVYNPGQIKKSTSGRTLNTNICYLDREASRCEDVASNTQAELDRLFAYVQSLPDTPYNAKIKKQLTKATTTPKAPTPMKKHVRSKSIGASIKKRLPSLGRSKNRRQINGSSISSSSSSSSTDSKTATPSLTDLLQSPAVSLVDGARNPGHHSRSRRKRNHSVNALSECSPPKQESREPSLDTSDTPKAKPRNSSLPNVLTSNPEAAQTEMSNITEATSSSIATDSSSTNVAALQSTLWTSELSHGNNGIVNTACQLSPENKQPERPNPSTSPDENKFPAAKDQGHEPSPKKPVERERHQPGTSLVQTPLTPTSKVFQNEKEITYIPQQATNKSQKWIHERNMPLPNKHTRPCNAPGTPVMPRSLFRLAQCDTLETSI
ncbi:rho GTPase-activating protein 19 [Elysia marginata]|uniref:Rho GTPase-activating protein 19 n=1 Tax=Elysia marginata TaxID=1093978 RepID=A0AAV4G4S0_9GAST|nr:rho GTPase-activating protein 19 [Elysia marginata]